MAVRRSRVRRSRRSPCKYGRKKSMRHGCKSKPGPKRRRSRRKSRRRSRRKSRYSYAFKSQCKYGRKKSGRKGCKSKPGRKRKSAKCSGRKKRSCKKSKRCAYRKSPKSGRRRCVRRSRRKPVTRPNLSVRTRPITREELENRTYRPFVQLGEKVDGEMKWKAPTKTVIKYMENANMAGEEGMDVGEGWGFTFGSFGDMGPGIYGRYGGQSEYAMRVLEQAHSYGYEMFYL